MELIIASFIGAVIGYITNWLAIKMLFRPHGEKRLFGIRLPFTPGLIPKERYRIAKSVGETVGAHLLTGDVIKKALCSEEMNEQLNGWIKNKVEELKESSLTIGENISLTAGNGYDKLVSSMGQKFTGMIVRNLRTVTSREKILDSIEGYVKTELNVAPKDLFQNQYVKSVKDNILIKFEEIKASKDFKEKVEKYIDEKLKELEASDKTIEEIVPESILAAVKSYIYNNRADICAGIEEMLKQPDMEIRIKKVVSTIIGSNLSPLVAMFISTDIIYGKLASALEEYLKEDENQKNTVLAINEGFDRISKNKITDLLASYNEGERASSIGSVSEFILNSVLTGSFISSVIEDIEKGLCEFASINELLAYFDVNYMEVLKNFIRNKVDSFIMSNGFQLIVEGFVQDGVIQILNTPLKEFINENQENITAMSSNIARDVFDKFVENEAADLVEVLNIPQIVEERINSFDVAFAEKIIIDIANKELSAITWLGALLGAIIGVLSPILS